MEPIQIRQRPSGSSISTNPDGFGSVSPSMPDLDAGTRPKVSEPHPSGQAKHGLSTQIIRMVAFVDWFCCVCCSTHATQILGSPLYFINKDYYYAYMSLTKQSFGLLITTITQWFSPTLIRVSGDKSVRGQLKQTKDGRLEVDFPERIVLISNHQLYSDWLYLWWIAYTNSHQMHGHVYIILKESLKYIPVIGPGIMFFGFVFLARNWAKDKPRFQRRLQQLKGRHSGPMSGTQALDPMWLMIYPEGTNLSGNTRKRSVKWADKQGIPDLTHQLLPRSTGLQYCLQELKGTVDWIYDCTVAYEGIPRGQYGQDIFTLRSTYLQGRPPKSVNMYWRRFAVSSVPVDDAKAFEAWILDRWKEKEVFLELYAQTGRFPADDGHDEDSEVPIGDGIVGKPVRGAGFIETEVKLASWWEVGQIFVPLLAFALVANVLAKIWNLALYGNMGGSNWVAFRPG